MIHEIRYVAWTDGTTEVLIPTMEGPQVRALAENERVISLNAMVVTGVTGTVPATILRAEGGVLVEDNPQPTRGDLVVATCGPSDAPLLAGQVAVVDEDGRLVAATTGLRVELQGLLDEMAPVPARAVAPTTADSPVELAVGDRVVVVSADTTAGDVVVVLPDASEVRSLLVTNRVGGGYVEIRAVQAVWPSGGTTVILGPGDRATLHAFGGGWEMV